MFKKKVSLLFLCCVICVNVFCTSCDKNELYLSEDKKEADVWEESEREEVTYVINKRSKKIHKTTCGTGDLILPENRAIFEGDIDELYDRGYTKCGNCFK